LKLLIVTVIVLIINVPFGYWRDSVKRFSVKWFLAVHLPVPFVVLVRIYSDLGFQLVSYPVIVGAFFLGQYAGTLIHRNILKKRSSILDE
jgi:hypothetical protein